MKRLHVYILEVKDLPPSKDVIGLPDAYAKVRLGKCEARTRTVRRSLDPVWNEEFAFEVKDDGGGADDQELQVWVFCEGKGGAVEEEEDELLGYVNIPVRSGTDDGEQSLPPTWFSLQSVGNDHYKAKDCGTFFRFFFLRPLIYVLYMCVFLFLVDG